MWRDFEGGVYWAELTDYIGRDFKGAVGFRGTVRFEEIL